MEAEILISFLVVFKPVCVMTFGVNTWIYSGYTSRLVNIAKAVQ